MVEEIYIYYSKRTIYNEYQPIPDEEIDNITNEALS